MRPDQDLAPEVPLDVPSEAVEERGSASGHAAVPEVERHLARALSSAAAAKAAAARIRAHQPDGPGAARTPPAWAEGRALPPGLASEQSSAPAAPQTDAAPSVRGLSVAEASAASALSFRPISDSAIRPRFRAGYQPLQPSSPSASAPARPPVVVPPQPRSRWTPPRTTSERAPSSPLPGADTGPAPVRPKPYLAVRAKVASPDAPAAEGAPAAAAAAPEPAAKATPEQAASAWRPWARTGPAEPAAEREGRSQAPPPGARRQSPPEDAESAWRAIVPRQRPGSRRPDATASPEPAVAEGQPDREPEPAPLKAGQTKVEPVREPARRPRSDTAAARDPAGPRFARTLAELERQQAEQRALEPWAQMIPRPATSRGDDPGLRDGDASGGRLRALWRRLTGR